MTFSKYLLAVKKMSGHGFYNKKICCSIMVYNTPLWRLVVKRKNVKILEFEKSLKWVGIQKGCLFSHQKDKSKHVDTLAMITIIM